MFRRNNKHGVRRVVEQVEERKNEEFREGTRVASRCTAICAIAGGWLCRPTSRDNRTMAGRGRWEGVGGSGLCWKDGPLQERPENDCFRCFTWRQGRCIDDPDEPSSPYFSRHISTGFLLPCEPWMNEWMNFVLSFDWFEIYQSPDREREREREREHVCK